jgi:hypothetical protein
MELVAGWFITTPPTALAEPTYQPESPTVESVQASSTTKVEPPAQFNYHADKEWVVSKILEVFPDAPIMVVVAQCESSLNPLADRENRNVDVGLFQINQVHNARLAQLGLDRWDIDDNLAYARMLYDESGLQPWYMSKHCWSRFV